MGKEKFGKRKWKTENTSHAHFWKNKIKRQKDLEIFAESDGKQHEHINKKDTAVGIKLFNTSGGFIEERSFSGITKKQFVNCPKINLDNIKYFASDEKYLIGDAVRNIKTPYISGWIDFNLNHPASKDIDLVYIVDRPDPATILKIYVKTKLLTNYLN